MKLFFSYGHDKNEEIVLRLKKDIERRNHEVWIDKSKIKSGDDWRRSITSGIIDSEFVMSFASNHSVRKPGVCLDELMIAVSVKGAQVQTVLLETNVVPPSNIGYRQYINMSNWQKMKESPDFEAWYAEKLNEIIGIIESPETAKYAEEIEYLKEQLSPDLSTMKKDRLQQEYFCGREWLSKEVKEWIYNKTDNQILLIDGAPGVGKSSYMAHEFIFNPSVGAIIFCEWDQPNFNNLDSISRSLVFQLATKISDYRYQIIKYLKNEQARTGSASYMPQSGESVFQLLFIQQLKNLIDGERPITLILIDGIDEVTDNQNNKGRRKNVFAELLHREITHFPRWIRFVITSRRDVSVLKPLQDAVRVHIEENSESNLQDLLQYLQHELSNEIEMNVIKNIAKKCNGNFLYAKMICMAIKEHKVTLEEILNGKAGDLGYIYRSYFDRTFTDLDEYEKKYYLPLAALATTEEAIPKSTFQRITGWSDRQMNQAIKTLSPYLSSSRDFFALYHKSVRDWLLSSEADDYMIDKLDGIRFIANGCYKAYKNDIHTMNSYEMKYLIPFMEQLQDKCLLQIKGDALYADILMENAKSEKMQFKYENAVCYAEMALDIYIFLRKILKALTGYLFLAEVSNLMVHLDESKDYCCKALVMADNSDRTKDIQEVKGDIYMRLAYVCFQQADWGNSISGYDSAKELFEACNRQEKQITALMMKANILRHANRAKEALQCYENMKDIPAFSELKDKDPALYASVLMNHGWALYNAGTYAEAEEKLIEAEKMIEADDGLIPLKDIAQLYYLRGVMLFDLAEYEKAEKYCNNALYYVQLAYGDNAVEICSALNQLGAIAQKLNDHNKAVRLFKRSYDVRLNYYGENNLFTSISQRNYAKALIRRGEKEDFSEAKEAFENVYKTRKRLCTKNKGTGWFAQINLDLADYCERTGNYSKAKDYVIEAEKLYEDCDIDKDIGTCKMQRGIISFSEGHKEEAKSLFSEAICIRKKYYDTNHPYIKELQSWLMKCEE